MDLERLFPTLTSEQTRRVTDHGRRRRVRAGEVLLEPGFVPTHAFVVLEGHLDILQSAAPDQAPLVARLGAGQFTGEANMLSGRRGMVRLQAVDDGLLIALDRDELR